LIVSSITEGNADSFFSAASKHFSSLMTIGHYETVSFSGTVMDLVIACNRFMKM
jgi:hypothetical protein